MPNPLILGHRGASADAPENTVQSCMLAFLQGAGGIEIDLRLTKDRQLAVIHDSSLTRTGGVPLRVADSTMAKLRSVDVGGWMGEGFSGARVPTLEEIVSLVPEGGKLFIEIKSGAEILPVLAQQLAKGSLKSDQVRILSFDLDVLAAAKESLSKWQRVMLFERKSIAQRNPLLPDVPMMKRLASNVGVVGVALDRRGVLSEKYVASKILKAGLELHVWTVNRRSDFNQLAKLGVTSVMTDRPRRVA